MKNREERSQHFFDTSVPLMDDSEDQPLYDRVRDGVAAGMPLLCSLSPQALRSQVVLPGVESVLTACRTSSKAPTFPSFSGLWREKKSERHLAVGLPDLSGSALMWLHADLSLGVTPFGGRV